MYKSKPEVGSFTRKQLEYALLHSDKELFIKFRDGQISYDQLVARGAEKKGCAKYLVLDDIKKKLNPDILEDEEFLKDYKLRFGDEGEVR